MLRILLILIFALGCFGSAAGQGECPKPGIKAPSRMISEGEIFILTAILPENALAGKTEFIWSVSLGEIIEGQGTPEIKIKATAACADLSAILKIKSDGMDCETLISAASVYCQTNICYSLADYQMDIDQMSEFPKIDNQLIELNNDPSAKALITFFINEKDNMSEVRSRAAQILRHVVRRGYDQGKIVFAVVRSGGRIIRPWIIPEGAKYPPYVKNAVFINGSEISLKAKKKPRKR